MFPGKEDDKVLRTLIKVYGYQKISEYYEQSNVVAPPEIDAMIEHYKDKAAKGYSYYANPEIKQFVSADALDLLDELLQVNPVNSSSPKSSFSLTSSSGGIRERLYQRRLVPLTPSNLPHMFSSMQNLRISPEQALNHQYFLDISKDTKN